MFRKWLWMGNLRVRRPYKPSHKKLRHQHFKLRISIRRDQVCRSFALALSYSRPKVCKSLNVALPERSLYFPSRYITCSFSTSKCYTYLLLLNNVSCRCWKNRFCTINRFWRASGWTRERSNNNAQKEFEPLQARVLQPACREFLWEIAYSLFIMRKSHYLVFRNCNP